jgi:hypothetical protein
LEATFGKTDYAFIFDAVGKPFKQIGVNPSIFLDHSHAAQGYPDSPNPVFLVFD